MKCFLFAFLSLLPILGHAQLDHNEIAISKILANADYCVRSIEENKIYLNPERIHSCNDRVYIDLNGMEDLLVPCLHYDAGGEYFFAEELRYYYCPNEHLTPRKDRRCLVSSCEYYCGSPNG